MPRKYTRFSLSIIVKFFLNSLQKPQNRLLSAARIVRAD